MALSVTALLGAGASVAALSATDAITSNTPAKAQTPERVLGAFHSVALDSQLHYVIWLPPGYATSSSRYRYPVIYFLHGLPARPTSYQAVAWVSQALDRVSRPAILVVPQGTRRPNGDPEYLDWGPGHNWATALSTELPAFIDAHYRTIATRAGRALVGVSAGGYGATDLGLHHPDEFSVVESWSGYFEPTDATGETVLDLGSAEANAAVSIHALAGTLATQFKQYPTFLGFYVGRSDPTFVQDNLELNAQLTTDHVAHTFALYPGGHTLSLWQAHATAWLTMALTHLSSVVNP